MQHNWVFIFLSFIWLPSVVDAQDLKSYNVHLIDQGFFGYQLNPSSGELYYFFAEENLEILKEGHLQLDQDISQVFSEKSGNKGIVLVVWGPSQNYRKELIIIDPLGKIETFNLDGLLFPEVKKMVVLEKAFGFLGKMYSGRNFVQVMNLDADEPIPHILDNGQMVVDIAGYGQYVDVLTANVKSSGFINVELTTYDDRGNEINAYSPKLNFMMTSAKLVQSSLARYHIIGSYRKYRDEEFGGIYSLEVGHRNQQYFKVYAPSTVKGAMNVKKRIIKEGVKAGFDIIEIFEGDGDLTVVSIAGLKNSEKKVPDDQTPVLFHKVRVNDRIQEFIADSFNSESLKQIYTNPQMFIKNDQVFFLDHALSQEKNTPQIKNIHNNSFLSGIDKSDREAEKVLDYKILYLPKGEILIFGIRGGQVEKGIENFYLDKNVLNIH